MATARAPRDVMPAPLTTLRPASSYENLRSSSIDVDWVRAGLAASLLYSVDQRHVDLVASTFVHEVRQPLAAMSLCAEALRGLSAASGTPDLPRMRKVVDTLSRQVERTERLLQHLRRFMTHGICVFQPEDLNEVVREGLEHALQGSAADLTPVMRLAPSVQKISVDRVLVQQIIGNLVRNALEAMQHSAERTLSVTTEFCERREEAVITIADTGDGIPPSIARELFKPRMSSKPDGMGIGLFTCRRIAEQHGGSLSAAANPHGAGTIFTLTLPAVLNSRLPRGESASGTRASSDDVLVGALASDIFYDLAGDDQRNFNAA